MIPGSISGAYGLRAELRGQRRWLVRLSLWVGLGSVVGAALLLTLPGSAFDRVVPVLVGLAGLLVLAQPLVVRWSRRAEEHPPSRATGLAVGTVGIYSGYFGAAQGVMLIGAIGTLAPAPLRRVNAIKNVVAVTANGAAGLVYAVLAPVHWGAVLLLALGSACGGPIGAALAKRVPAAPLRLVSPRWRWSSRPGWRCAAGSGAGSLGRWLAAQGRARPAGPAAAGGTRAGPDSRLRASPEGRPAGRAEARGFEPRMGLKAQTALAVRRHRPD